MSALRQSLADYLSLRRSLGYSLQRSEKQLGQFIDYLDACGPQRSPPNTLWRGRGCRSRPTPGSDAS